VLESEETPGGGSGVILGPVIGTGGTGTSTGGGGPTVAAATPRAVMAATTAVEAAAVTAAAVTAGSSSSSVRATSRVGQSHKLTKGEGGLPPWATANGHADDNADQVNGHGDVPPGHDPDHGHGNSHGKEHARGHANGHGGNG
jgi:hypothetical protein